MLQAIEPESFDYVIGTHVLCSVPSVGDILQQVTRALKVGGVYLFYEHVQADKSTRALLRLVQDALSPIVLILGDGCRFRPLWNNLASKNEFPGFEVNLTKFDATVISFPVFQPHIIGQAVKMLSSSEIIASIKSGQDVLRQLGSAEVLHQNDL